MKRQAVGFATPTVHVIAGAGGITATGQIQPTSTVTAELRASAEWSKELKPPAEQSMCLRLCEMIVAITAPKGRIDEFLGDHRTELRNLVSEFGVARGTWICRLRLAGTTLRMLPAIAVRLWGLWKIS
jgi:hypothetical protein